MLVSSNTTALFHIEANSLDFVTSLILPQELKVDSKYHPITFFSKSFFPVEYNHKIHNKEILMIIWAFKECQYFLKGTSKPYKKSKQTTET